MNRIIDRAIILAVTSLGVALYASDKIIYIVLVGIIAAGLCYFFYDSIGHMILCICIGTLIAIDNTYVVLILPLVYETVSEFRDGRRKEIAIPAMVVAVVAVKYITYETPVITSPIVAGIMIIGLLLSVYLACYTGENDRLKSDNLRMRDDNEEFRRFMLDKNKLLQTKQDNEITMATLKERNRIAREIHDNVGHLLSRAIVQMGALQIISKDNPTQSDAIRQVSDTLGECMDNIRKSVHDLHNESFDLEKALKDIVDKNTGYEVVLNYDMGVDAPLQVKYCEVSIVSEALHNVKKHSDATKVDITVAEHPAFYQLIIKDNGHPKKISESGIGIHNMQSRVDELGGSISISTDNGFRIFVTIPKKREG